MLARLRTLAKSPFAYGLFFLLIVAFAVFGIRDMFHGRISNAVITAGSREVSPYEYKRVFGAELKRIEQQQGQPVNLADAIAAGFDKQVLTGLAANEAFAEFVQRLGVVPADRLVGEAIAKQPDFFNRVTGRFDPVAYQGLLAQNQLTPAIFEGIERDQIAQSQLSTGIAAGLRAPATYGALIAGYEFEGRALTFFTLTPQHVAPPSPPTDAQLQAFLDQNAAALKRPEMRVLSVVRFSAKALAPSMPVDGAALQKLYDFRKDTASTPETRSLVQIPVKDAAMAASVAARLRQGADPNAVAKSVGAQPIVYANTPKSGIADPKIADAAFAMKSGEVSGPILGGLSLDVIKLGEIKPAHQATLDEMRPQLEAQVRSDAAGQKIYEQVQKYEDAHSGGASMADAAKAAGSMVMSVGPLTARGVDADRQPVQGLSDRLVTEAFKLPAGGESDMESEASGEYFAVRVEKVIPPSTPGLAEIKPQLAQAYMNNEMARSLQAKAEELIARINKGETIEAVAASASAPIQHADSITRAALARNQVVGQALAGRIFAAKKGEVFAAPTLVGSTGQVAVMVARLDNIQPPPAAQAAMAIAQTRDRLSAQIFQDIGALLRNEAVAKVKPTQDVARAREALGLSPDAAKSGAAPASGSPPQ